MNARRSRNFKRLCRCSAPRSAVLLTARHAAMSRSFCIVSAPLIEWREYVKKYRIIKWLYVDDILPR